jgi:L-arabinose isomerase
MKQAYEVVKFICDSTGEPIKIACSGLLKSMSDVEELKGQLQNTENVSIAFTWIDETDKILTVSEMIQLLNI